MNFARKRNELMHMWGRVCVPVCVCECVFCGLVSLCWCATGVCLSRATGTAACIQIKCLLGSQHVAAPLLLLPRLVSTLLRLPWFDSSRFTATRLGSCTRAKKLSLSSKSLPSWAGQSEIPNEHPDWGRIRNLSNSYLQTGRRSKWIDGLWRQTTMAAFVCVYI